MREDGRAARSERARAAPSMTLDNRLLESDELAERLGELPRWTNDVDPKFEDNINF